MDEFIEDLENKMNQYADAPEPVAFMGFEERGRQGVHSEKRDGLKFCWHNKKTLNDAARMTQCDDCGAFIDPYDALRRMVKNRENDQIAATRISGEIDRLTKKEAMLKKELKSLNGKINRRKQQMANEQAKPQNRF